MDDLSEYIGWIREVIELKDNAMSLLDGQH
jgi:hypothetical protein